MTTEMKPLEKNNEVYVKSLDMLGVVLGVRPGDVEEPEEAKFYEVQITRYFRRVDLELEDREAEREKRDAAIRQKTDRLEAARKAIEDTVKTGRDVKPAQASEWLIAMDDLWQALGHKPFLAPVKGSSKK